MSRTEFYGRTASLVELTQDHPGFLDPDYRRRRDSIAQLALEYTTADPLPSVDYNDTEHGVWKTVWQKLTPLHQRHACTQALDGLERFAFDRDRIPSFTSVNAALEPLEGFVLTPVAGLVEPQLFLQQLGERRFLATQYMRHHSQPLYTPEPDVVHEYIGHVGSLSHPDSAELNLAFGQAAAQAPNNARVEQLIRMYWYTLEFGLVEQNGEPKAHGAGLLSSFGELDDFAHRAELSPWDLDNIAHTDFDPTTYQHQLFVAPSFTRMRDDLLAWLGR